MKTLAIFVLAVFLVSFVSAIDINVTKITEDETMLYGTSDPASFSIDVTNNGNRDYFYIYTFYGLGIQPRDGIEIKKGETKQIDLEIYPRPDSTDSGKVTFPYYIRDSKKDEFQQKMTLNIAKLEKAFEVSAGEINPESNSVEITFKNKINFDFKDLDVKLTSAFFNIEDKFSLAPYAKKTFEVKLNKSDFDELTAGYYTLKSDVTYGKLNSEFDNKINFVEKDIVREISEDYGFIITTTLVKKTNEGNTVEDIETSIHKNAISRLFTTFSPEPDTKVRDGLSVDYMWKRSVLPGETFEVKVTTNWLIPFIVILLIVLTIVFFRKYSQTDLVLRKHVSFVKAKGGEFALKVMINVEAKNYVEKVKLVDRLPPLVKVYGRFGGETPKRYHRGKKTFEWEFPELHPGEKRSVSYIIYSKVGVLGRFALPNTFALYEREGKQKETTSNKSFFLSEQKMVE